MQNICRIFFAWASEIFIPSDFKAAIISEVSITPLKSEKNKCQVKVSEKITKQNVFRTQ